MNDKSTAVRTDRVWKTYNTDGLAVHAVRGISIEIHQGEFVVLAGPSGSGKTTLLNLLGGLTRPTQGSVHIDGADLTDLSEKQLARLRLERVGFVFQAYNLLPVLSALENAEFPLLLRGTDDAERRKLVTEFFDRIGLAGLHDRRPRELSGGQQQRVAVARAVVGSPALVLADEPTANLDSTTSNALVDLMLELNEDLATTFVFATHNENLMERAKRVIHIVDGEVDFDRTA